MLAHEFSDGFRLESSLTIKDALQAVVKLLVVLARPVTLVQDAQETLILTVPKLNIVLELAQVLIQIGVLQLHLSLMLLLLVHFFHRVLIFDEVYSLAILHH